MAETDPTPTDYNLETSKTPKPHRSNSLRMRRIFVNQRIAPQGREQNVKDTYA